MKKEERVLGTLAFPNPSRTYDFHSGEVRFWGYDQAMEIVFLVTLSALTRLDPKIVENELGYLNAFDVNRLKILQAARRVYRRQNRAQHRFSYRITDADL